MYTNIYQEILVEEVKPNNTSFLGQTQYIVGALTQ
jgi:hypothetical protein